MTFHAGIPSRMNLEYTERLLKLLTDENEQLKKGLRTQLIDFMTFHSGDENSCLPEGLERVIDIYIETKRI